MSRTQNPPRFTPRGGSTPPPGTKLTLAVPITSLHFCNARGRGRRSHFCRIGAEIGAVLGSGTLKFLDGGSLIGSAHDRIAAEHRRSFPAANRHHNALRHPCST